MALPNSSTISFDSIRKELGFSNTTNFSINSAEDEQYKVLNRCSPYKPLASNPASMSEWYGYDDAIACDLTEYSGTICTIYSESCNSIFSASDALANVQLYGMSAVAQDLDNLNENWYLINANKFPQFSLEIYYQNRSTIPEVIELVYTYSGGSFSNWNLIGNAGNYNGTFAGSGNYNWFYKKYPTDGWTQGGSFYAIKPTVGNYYESLFKTGATQAECCGASITSTWQYIWHSDGKLALGESIRYPMSSSLWYAPAGYYRRNNLNEWYQVTGSFGVVTAKGTC